MNGRFVAQAAGGGESLRLEARIGRLASASTDPRLVIPTDTDQFSPLHRSRKLLAPGVLAPDVGVRKVLPPQNQKNPCLASRSL